MEEMPVKRYDVVPLGNYRQSCRLVSTHNALGFIHQHLQMLTQYYGYQHAYALISIAAGDI
jgi:hypothetical protein